MTWEAADGGDGSLAGSKSKTAGTTLTHTVVGTTTELSVGKYIVLAIAFDNISGSADQVSSVTDTGGNTYSYLGHFSQINSDASVTAISIWGGRITTALTSSSSVITVNFATSLTAKALTAWSFNCNSGTVTVANTVTQATFGPDTPSMTTGTIQVGDLVIRGSGIEAPEISTFTATSGWQARCVGTTGSGGASNSSVYSEWKVAASTTETSDPTVSTADQYHILITLREPAASGSNTSNFFQLF